MRRSRCSGEHRLLINRVIAIIASGFAASLAGSAASAQPTLNNVKNKGFLTCGSNGAFAGFSFPDVQGNWTGLDTDLCRAIAAAIFSDAKEVSFMPLSAKDRFTALQSGEVDVLVRNTTWTFTRDTPLGLDFVGVTYYDGQGFMVPQVARDQSATKLDGASVCVQTGTTTELNLADYFRANNMSYDAGRVRARRRSSKGI